MNLSNGNINIPLIECINPIKRLYKVRWNLTIDEGGNTSSFMEETFKEVPSIETLKGVIIPWYNKKIEKSIIEDFKWKDMNIWLSTENQMNYKAMYDYAVQSEGSILPITFKFGTDESPIYYTFNDLSTLKDFYESMIKHINSKLTEGWNLKDSIDWSKYTL